MKKKEKERISNTQKYNNLCGRCFGEKLTEIEQTTDTTVSQGSIVKIAGLSVPFYAVYSVEVVSHNFFSRVANK